MFTLWCILAGLLLYEEIVYHFAGYGWSEYNLLYTVLLITVWSGVGTMLIGILRGRIKKICYYLLLWFPVIWTSAQLVYLRIFKQPLLLEAMFVGGGDALTNYWREALHGILATLPFMILLVLPVAVSPIILKKCGWTLPDFSKLQIMRTAGIIIAGLVGSTAMMQIGKNTGAVYYEDYQEFYDPLTIAKTMGVLPTLQRDLAGRLASLTAGLWKQDAPVSAMSGPKEENQAASQSDAKESGMAGGESGAPEQSNPDELVNMAENNQPADGTGRLDGTHKPDGTGEPDETDKPDGIGEPDETDKPDGTGEPDETDKPDGTGEPDETDKPDGTDRAGEHNMASDNAPDIIKEEIPYFHQYELDYELLHSLANNEQKTWLADYIESLAPASSNEYTGMFEGYNLIYLTAEGFSTYAIDEELTPTLYRLTHSGFVFENYYVPLWQTSTSDGEYINCTGLIPDGQFSMRKSISNNMAFTLPAFFAAEGVSSFAYHDGSLDYYDRYLTHPNLGYGFKACKLGKLSGEEWGSMIFPMENPYAWPASDLEMMEGTMPEYLGKERFHVYYMTVSGHMNYDFKGNSMSAKNQEAVSELEMSENARAYIACHIELDKALEYMLQQLEEAGQLDRTVICMSADHYPYGMSMSQYEELSGTPLSNGMDLYRNSLILWNAGMEDTPVYVSKACGSMDIIPTLLNLFGFDYDSRMFAGRDIFSDTEGMVIFNDRSFVTDSVIYKKGKGTVWLQDEEGNDLVSDEQKEDYLKEKKQEVKDRYQFSAYILRENYYSDIEQAVIAPPDADSVMPR